MKDEEIISDTLSIKQVATNDNAINSIPDTIVTNRVLVWAKYVDSLGYINDTVRFKNSSARGYHEKAINHLVDNRVIYEINFEETVPYLFITSWSHCDSDTVARHVEWCKQWGLNIHDFNTVEKVAQYFFVQKNPEHYVDYENKRVKKYVDGVVEEWKFPNANLAKRASEELGSKEEMVFMNCGAFVCYIDKYMYVFHSRASDFMYYISPLFKKFVKDNNAIITKRKNS